MPDQTQVIREQIRNTQSDLAEKLALLESRMSQGVRDAKSAVTDTVELVQEKFRVVREALSLKLYVHEYPWACAAAALALGLVGGRLLRATDTSATPSSDALQKAANTYVKEVTPLALGVAMGFVRDALKKGVPPEIRSTMAELIDGATLRLGGTVVHEEKSGFCPSH